jgi:uncharacterized membrane protein
MARKSIAALLGRWMQILSIGALALTPFALTIWFIWLLLQLAAFLGGMVAGPVLNWMAVVAPGLEALLVEPVVVVAIELIFALAIITAAGVLAGNGIGRLVEAQVNRMVAKIPIANVVYSSARQLVQTLQSPADAAQQVVLIEFPSEHMKAVGLVTRRFRAADTGEELAAVYVPTTPNPTSGYVEIVPCERLVWLDWSTSEAIQFIVSAGITAPQHIRYRKDDPTLR